MTAFRAISHRRGKFLGLKNMIVNHANWNLFDA